MLDIDPILTADEQNLILIYNTSVQVYNAIDSLLVRRIPICALDASAPQGSTPTTIIAARLSVRNANLIWVACSDGQVHHVDWTIGKETPASFQTTSGTVKAMAIVPATDKGKEDVVLVAESEKAGRMDIVAYQGPAFSPQSLLVLKKPGDGLQLLEASEDGQVLVGAFQDRVLLGLASPAKADELNEVKYEFFSFDTSDLITSLDMRIHGRSNQKRQAGSDADPVVDIITGGARGGICVYRDALSRVRPAGKQQGKDGIEVQRFHWHRKAVHSVKWSRDGHYFISGGSENVLVIWQVDTSKRGFLPHLSGCVENIVVSASGASYVLHLDDNSAMILSTAELKPTTFVSGIQSATAEVGTPKDSLVKRVWTVADQVRRPVPAAINPLEASKLHVCVGSGRQTTMSGAVSAPLLQTFDLESFTSVSKEALVRTQTTDVNISSKGHVIDEPLVSHIAFSGDGKWLASIDEWKPPARDVENVPNDLREQFIRERQEIHLKFWQVSDQVPSLALVSRVDSPHAISQPEAVLDLAASPAATCFATLGTDGVVRLWRPKPRQQDGLAMKDSAGQDAVSWCCSQLIAVGGQLGQEPGTDVSAAAAPQPQGSVAFSEDGSTLFAAFGTADTGIVYVIDTASGDVVKILDGLWDGRLQAVGALSSLVIVLSDELRVYDVVSDELRYGIVMPKTPGLHELLQLAVDRASGHFAVALPLGASSSIGVFDPDDPEPVLVRSVPHRIVSLVSAPATSGFLALDDAAQLWVVSEGSDPAALGTAQPLHDMRLDGPAAESESPDVIALQEADPASDDDDEADASVRRSQSTKARKMRLDSYLDLIGRIAP
ncbi:hypothetical protein CDD83_8912 [Cordyceps sp. RAO-2017]|nr:hypothetical protein CDD83_8912 [Cordyceps sp. RAO-2017]